MAWIRSQDQETLLNVKSLWIEPFTKFGVDSSQVKEHRLYAETNQETQWRLGEFPTHYAALVELDRIERWIADGAQGVHQVSPED